MVEGVDVQDTALSEDLVLIKGDDLAQQVRGEFACQNRVRGVVSIKYAVRYLRSWDSFLLDLVPCLFKGQGLRLAEEVGHQQVVVVPEGVVCLREADEVTRYELRPLVNELVEGVLAVGAGLSPYDGSRLIVGDPLAVTIHRFALLSMSSCWRYEDNRQRYWL